MRVEIIDDQANYPAWGKWTSTSSCIWYAKSLAVR
jgi:hypothetical protein